MRISDWSSDVCSSDLPVGGHHLVGRRGHVEAVGGLVGGMVVDREERGGPGWLRRDVGLAPVDLPAAAEQAGAYPYGLGPPLEADLRGEDGPFGDGRGSGVPQPTAPAPDPGRLTADQTPPPPQAP